MRWLLLWMKKIWLCSFNEGNSNLMKRSSSAESMSGQERTLTAMVFFGPPSVYFEQVSAAIGPFSVRSAEIPDVGLTLCILNFCVRLPIGPCYVNSSKSKIRIWKVWNDKLERPVTSAYWSLSGWKQLQYFVNTITVRHRSLYSRYLFPFFNLLPWETITTVLRVLWSFDLKL